MIERTWGQRYKLFSNVPFSILFEPEPDWEHLFFTTSIDYVLCTNKGQFLLAIDFDGLRGGFDKYGRYNQVKEPHDPQREKKFNKKLEYAARYNFPYHIVASNEFESLGDDIALTVVDGIIGHELADREFSRRAESGDFENLSAAEDAEFDAHLRHNPIVGKCAEILAKIAADHDIFDHDVFRAPSREWIDIEDGWIARRCTIFHRNVGELSATAVIRDGTLAASIVGDIAKLLVYSKLLRLLRERPSQT